MFNVLLKFVIDSVGTFRHEGLIAQGIGLSMLVIVFNDLDKDVAVVHAGEFMFWRALGKACFLCS